MESESRKSHHACHVTSREMSAFSQQNRAVGVTFDSSAAVLKQNLQSQLTYLANKEGSLLSRKKVKKMVIPAMSCLWIWEIPLMPYKFSPFRVISRRGVNLHQSPMSQRILGCKIVVVHRPHANLISLIISPRLQPVFSTIMSWYKEVYYVQASSPSCYSSSSSIFFFFSFRWCELKSPRYSRYYHPYCPIAPSHLLRSSCSASIQKSDYFLLTAILTIASRDDPRQSLIHRYCWDHTQRLLVDVLLAHPWTQTPRTVEGLLILAEWLPHIQTQYVAFEGPKNLFSEDRTTWSLIGLAVRQGYLQRLDQGAFPNNDSSQSKERVEQNRLVWACR